MKKQTEKLYVRLLFCGTPAAATSGIAALIGGLIPALMVFAPVFMFGWLMTKPHPQREEGQ